MDKSVATPAEGILESQVIRLKRGRMNRFGFEPAWNAYFDFYLSDKYLHAPLLHLEDVAFHLFLRKHLNDADPAWRMPSIPQMKRRLGVSQDKLEAMMRRLHQAHLLTKVSGKRQGRLGADSANTYLLSDPIQELSEFLTVAAAGKFPQPLRERWLAVPGRPAADGETGAGSESEKAVPEDGNRALPIGGQGALPVSGNGALPMSGNGALPMNGNHKQTYLQQTSEQQTCQQQTSAPQTSAPLPAGPDGATGLVTEPESRVVVDSNVVGSVVVDSGPIDSQVEQLARCQVITGNEVRLAGRRVSGKTIPGGDHPVDFSPDSDALWPDGSESKRSSPSPRAALRSRAGAPHPGAMPMGSPGRRPGGDGGLRTGPGQPREPGEGRGDR